MNVEQSGQEQLRNDVQDGLLQTIRHGEDRRTWAISFFFRILTPEQFRLMLLYYVTRSGSHNPDEALAELLAEHRELMDISGNDLAQMIRSESAVDVPVNPLDFFRAWISVLLSGNSETWLEAVIGLAEKLNFSGDERSTWVGLMEGGVISALEGLGATGDMFGDIFGQLPRTNGEEQSANGASIGNGAVEGGLLAVCLYEFFRYLDPFGTVQTPEQPLLRPSAVRAANRPDEGGGRKDIDRSPVNIAFTHQGLSRLEVAQDTLASFPEPFREGMARRAVVLGDTGPSAPGFWDGRLGQDSVHGVLTGGFAAEDASADAWNRLHKEVATFNRAGPGEGEQLRRIIDLLFLLVGVQIVHIELGQDPFHVGSNGKPVFPMPRREHFGFRDGIGQPFRDLDLSEGRIGDGVYEDGAWRNLKPGEIYLGHEDEDNALSPLPTSEKLRKNGTYLVFRKLEQDVPLFHSFTEERYPDDTAAQAKMKARIVGRWPNGADLVRNPESEPKKVDEKTISKFLFREPDTEGEFCPLGAHMRRVNPRDIGDTLVLQRKGSTRLDPFTRRHRIQRRSIGYGGAFHDADPNAVDVPRGLLFSAYNARIDLQFEVIQSRWINRGDFLGQAGLNRDALVGANRGRAEDQFQEPSEAAPVAKLPAFVTTRGGDYFFVPSLSALRCIAKGDPFGSDAPFPGDGFAEPPQPGLFSREAVQLYIETILTTDKRAVRVVPEKESNETPAEPIPGASSEAELPVVFVARHADVTRVLNSEQNTPYTVKRYGRVSKNLTGGKMLLALQRVGGDTTERVRLSSLLQRAWTNMGTPSALERITTIFEKHAEDVVRKAKTSGRIDLVHELITQASYKAVEDVFGVTGPKTPANVLRAISPPDTLIDALHDDWQDAFKKGSPETVGMASMVVWASASLLELILNINEHGEVASLGTSAGTECTEHLYDVIAAWTPEPHAPPTLLQELMNLAPPRSPAKHRKDVMLILNELVGSMLSILPLTFGRLMHTLLTSGVNLPLLVPALDEIVDGPDGPIAKDHAIERLIYETLRLNPSHVPLLRHVDEKGAELPGDEWIKGPCWVAALTSGAGFDKRAFPEPGTFSLHPVVPGPDRPIDKYLPFGPAAGEKTCWGQKIAMAAMVRGIRAASGLPGLGRVAGPTGEPLKLLQFTVGLQAKCAREWRLARPV